MFFNSTLATAFLLGLGLSSTVQNALSQDQTKSKPIELALLKASLGVWDAEIEVWPEGTDSPSIKFKGVETNRQYGDYWIASDFDSAFEGQTMKVHSIVGYDLDKNQLVGMVIDHGPYAATMTGHHDQKTDTVHWTTKAKDENGNPILQKIQVTQKNADQRILVLMVPSENGDEFTKFMHIKFVKRK